MRKRKSRAMEMDRPDRLTEEQMEEATTLGHDVLFDPKVISTPDVKRIARALLQSRQDAEREKRRADKADECIVEFEQATGGLQQAIRLRQDAEEAKAEVKRWQHCGMCGGEMDSPGQCDAGVNEGNDAWMAEVNIERERADALAAKLAESERARERKEKALQASMRRSARLRALLSPPKKERSGCTCGMGDQAHSCS